MIPNQWYAVLESSEVKRGKPVGVTRLGEKLVFWRTARGEVACASDICAHRGAALSAGQIQGDHVACPFHGFQYDSTGQCRVIPAKGAAAPVPERFRVRAYPTREAHGFIWVWWGAARDDLPPLPFFDDLGDFVYATYRDHWRVHYSRAIENQLDVVHLPFVHKNSIGRGGRMVVDGPVVEWVNADVMHVYVYNRVDDGAPPRKPEEIPPPHGPFRLEFRFPHIWQNRISDEVRIVIAFAPIDEENTLLYLRFYQNFMTAPVLGKLISWISVLASMRIAWEDKRVVLTQQPKKSALRMGEMLIQGDRPIVAYRKRREELILANPQISK